jgi:hypothetical protein
MRPCNYLIYTYTLPPERSPTHYSKAVLISFYNFLKFYSGLFDPFLASSSRYLVPSNYLAFFWRSLEKFIPLLDMGLPVPTPPAPVPTFPLEGVGLYELGGGLIYNKTDITEVPLKSYCDELGPF